MSIFSLTKDNFEFIELQANPRREFSSSSSGLTGSIPLFTDASPSLKETEQVFGLAAFGEYDEATLEDFRQGLAGNFFDNLKEMGPYQPLYEGVPLGYFITDMYLDLVRSSSTSVPMSKEQEIIRFVPGVQFDKNFMRKRVVQNSLFPYYRDRYKSLQWSYTNYHCLNFITGTGLPSESVMIYPAGTGTVANQDWNPLAPSASFTFDFWIKPRSRPSLNYPYTAGTILHMSSCFAVSLVTGSAVGIDGHPSGFRILLQLSESANIPPRKCTVGSKKVTKSNSTADGGFLFASSDNSLKRNHWNHVSIRWPGNVANNGTGSFWVNGREDVTFNIQSGTVMQASSSGNSVLDPDALFVGNFYEGLNDGNSAIAKFFNPLAHQREGVIQFSDLLDNTDPTNYTFRHPLNAEVHDIKIYNTSLLDRDVVTGSTRGISLTPNLLFYLPPFFVRETRNRQILQTPFFETSGSTNDPFNAPLSFGVGGLSINLENFTRDLVTKQYPRLLNLSASTINTQVDTLMTANDLLYESGSSVKRNLTILPCDNGKFYPNFSLLTSGSFNTADPWNPEGLFVNVFGNRDLTVISLENMISSSYMLSTLDIDDRETVDMNARMVGTPELDALTGQAKKETKPMILSKLFGPSPEDPSLPPGSILTVLQRQRDQSSNEVVFFDISNIFYGDKIKPKTFVLEDLNVSGTHGRMSFKVRDDGQGNLYRADTESPPAKWASVGNIIYEEGIAVVKTPHLPLFGKDHFKVTFEGQKSLYCLEILIPAGKSLFNSSSNPAYKELAPSNYPSELAEKFTYLTGIQLHDENLNVIARANLAQPVVKRDQDRLVFRLSLDF